MTLFGSRFKDKFEGFRANDHSGYNNEYIFILQGVSDGIKACKNHYQHGRYSRIQGIASETGRPTKPQHDFVYRMAGAARCGENRTEEPARIERQGRRAGCSGQNRIALESGLAILSPYAIPSTTGGVVRHP
ncbi:MAG: hypothetical protein IPL59_04075 [Candidatus Competibacteraceae bacterium]|nr:hypothetical protein [Candidatus Competibacteraceae bacterium]